ncbi:Protein dachsous [Trichinella patagoniensis]|uniref:Protein dachsous n=1 Tax=Trichinella patagoniensis TaxID=990121 RepID=A0A0V1A3N6_9BILA|nr:Protein dachsous [Trichinella patagoniensis]
MKKAVQILTNVNAVDPDCGKNAEIKYSIDEKSASASFFKIDALTGDVCLNGELDYEKRKMHDIVVSAFDGGGLSSSAVIRVSVEDVNDNYPTFYPLVYNVSLRQSVLPGTPVLVVSATDLDSGLFGEVNYIISSGNDGESFRIEPHSGELYVNAKLFPTVYQLKIKAVDGGNFASPQMAIVTVTVLTENFPSPYFEEKFYRFTVREDALPGISVGRVVAHGQGSIAYHIYSGDPNGYFSIDGNTGEITVSKYLDHEERSVILLNIQAVLGYPPSYNHSQVQVIVEDINDNAPLFDQSYAEISVMEDHEVGIALYTAKATDRDSGLNGQIRYRLSVNPENTFMIHPVSGEIRLNHNRAFDYEKRKNYTLVITAQDGGIPSFTTEMTLLIFVLDANDHSPEFLQKIYRSAVYENAPLMTKIFQLKAIDLDHGANSQIMFKIDPNQETALNQTLEYFDVYADSGWIYVRKTLDREMIPEFSFVVTVRDNGEPKRSSTATVFIKILDVNDNAPIFESAAYEFSVEENQPKGTFVGQVVAHDADFGLNGTVRYRLDSEQVKNFHVSLDGKLITSGVLDYELTDLYELQIIAYDGGIPSLSTTCKVIVHVKDVNDNAPFFILPTRQDNILFREEQSSGTEVIQVQARDPDSGRNGTVRYRLDAESSTPPMPFRINRRTGIIYSTEVLDYEKGPTIYKVTVIAEDWGKPILSSKKCITIELVDIEDGSSYAEDNETSTFELSESVPVGTNIGSVDSERIGYLKNSKDNNSPITLEQLVDISYSISSGNSMGIFDIDPFTGALFTVRRLDYEMTNMHFLTVTRTNTSQTTFPKIKEFPIKIHVLDENDNRPVFSDDPVIFSLPENTPVGTDIWMYNATDADTGKFGRLKYRIIDDDLGNSKMFSIDPLRGVLQLQSELDYEKCTEYVIVVEATDQASSPYDRLSTQVTTRIYVVDVNDNSPKFISNSTVEIYEDSPTDYPLFYVIATDADWLENGRVTYSIKDRNVNSKFAINADTGALTLTRRLTKDDPNHYQLTVKATDHGKPPLSATQIIQIRVIPGHLNALRFERSSYRSSIIENTSPGSIVVQIKASEGDGKSTSNFTYHLLPGGNGYEKLKIDEITGIITTKESLDREEFPELVVAVIAENINEPSRFDISTVYVEVEDVNDNRPIINKDSCHPTVIPENVHMNNLVTIYATDRDSDLNARIVYSIVGGNDGEKFNINPQSGLVSCKALDRESRSQYNLTILVTDSGVSRLADSCNLIVTVSDENDNVPKFQSDVYSIDVVEDARPGTTVLKLTADDFDEGRNGILTYSIAEGGDGTFDVKPNTGEMVLLKPLNYESVKSYKLKVNVNDQGAAKQHWSTAVVNIKIIDVNDNAPVFIKQPFVATVSGKIAAGQRIVKITAKDADGPGLNSDLYYSFMETQSMYSINPVTGVISAKREITFKPGSIHFLKVIVMDKGEVPKKTVGLVKIIVEEEYGKTEELLSFEKDVYYTVIEKTIPYNSLVKQVKAIPKQFLGKSAPQVQYRIVAGNELKLFSIDQATGDIRIVSNYGEQVPFQTDHQLMIEAFISNENKIQSQLKAFCFFRVLFSQENNHPPQFLQQRYTVAIPEGKPRGTYVIQVSTVDLDIEENSQITYSIRGGNIDSAFSITSDGLVSTKIELDREIKDHYELILSATDFANPSQISTAELEITVLDVNDNTPSFPPTKPVFVKEDIPVGSFIASVTANDVDSFPALTYHFTEKGNPGEFFKIDKFSGQIMLAKRLDYEKQSIHTLEIQAYDGIHYASVKQIIQLIDINDNAPTFSHTVHQIFLSLGSVQGSTIGRITAVDEDGGENGRITYKLLKINDLNFARLKSTTLTTPEIWIDSNTGILYLNETLIRIEKYLPVFKLIVEASDNGKPQRSSRLPVVVQIHFSPVQEAARFTLPVYSFTVAENLPVHTVLGYLNITQTMSSSQHHLSYSINANGIFEIDALGRLIVMKPLDREKVDKYHFVATIQSHEFGVENSTTNVIIHVEDVNDNAPVFSHPEYHISVNESMPVGSVIMKLSASDEDIGVNSLLHFEITSGNIESTFAIENSTGVIKLQKKLDNTKINHYKLILKVTDSGVPARSSLAMCYVLVMREMSRNGPFFPVGLYLGHVKENSPNDTLIFTVKAVNDNQATSTSASEVFYFIKETEMEDDGKYFAINSKNGEVRAKQQFDYENRTSYKFTAAVRDSLGREHTVPCQVLIKGEDEYAPAFSEYRYVFKTTFDAVVNHGVGAVYADDKDDGLDGQVSYEIKEETKFFEIHPKTGVVTLRQSLEKLQYMNDEEELALIYPESQRYSELTSNGDSKDSRMRGVEKLFLFTVVAFSGTNANRRKLNTTTIEIQISKPLPSKAVPLSSAFIVSISAGLIFLCCCAAAIICIIRIRRPNVQPSMKSVSYPKYPQNNSKLSNSKYAFFKMNRKEKEESKSNVCFTNCDVCCNSPDEKLPTIPIFIFKHDKPFQVASW